jgi:HAD superfamily hydrolase (TIGR01459 family)
MNVTILGGIRSLAESYDTFVVDLWGTLHNGIVAYPGAADALSRLKAAGKRIALLSNAPRRAQGAVELLEHVGIARELYDTILTSGEAVHTALRDRPDAWHRRLKGPCWHLGTRRDRAVFDGLDIEIREEPEGCGFAVVSGAKMNEERVEDYQPELDRALKLGLPMICANPDIVVPIGDMLAICAGALCEYYEIKGGDVFWHGKPHGAAYRQLFTELEAATGQPVELERTIGIGDALPTDVAGAAGYGIASALVLSGLHKPELKFNWLGKPNKEALNALIDNAPAKPDHVLSRFAW